MTARPNNVIEVSSLPDRTLMRRFVQDGDEDAFTEIVQRHQGLVISVCRRILADQADIDDSFQATFVALARRPRSVRKAASLSSWLYTVAWRTSWRILRKRRKQPVEQLSDVCANEASNPLERIASAQDCVVLDEELNDLPSKYRDVLVMTYFRDRTSKQIADELDVSKGTIDGRIRQARNMLRVRLARRGVTLGAITFAAGLASGGTAAASETLLASTIQLGSQTLSNAVPATDLSPIEPFIQAETAMLTTKSIVTVVLCSGLVAGLAGMSTLAQEGAGQGKTVAAVPGQESHGRLEGRIEEGAVAGEASKAAEEMVADPFGSTGSVSVSPAKAESKTVAENSGDPFGAPFKDEGDRDKEASGAAVNRARYVNYTRDARPREAWMYGLMDKPILQLDYPGEASLDEVLDQLSEYLTTQYGQNGLSFTIHPDLTALSTHYGIASLENVVVKDIQFPAGLSLESALNIVFQQITELELTWEIRDEVFMVTAKEAANELSLIHI